MTGIISLEELKVEKSDGCSRLLFDYAIDGEAEQIYFEVEEKYGKYLCYELADPFIIAFLPYAMLRDFNIKSKLPATEDLLYNLNMYLIPTLARYNRELFRPKIDAPVSPLDLFKNVVGGGGG